MQSELEKLYDNLINQPEYMKEADERIEEQIKCELDKINRKNVDYEIKRESFFTVAEVAKKEAFKVGFNYAVAILKK